MDAVPLDFVGSDDCKWHKYIEMFFFKLSLHMTKHVWSYQDNLRWSEVEQDHGNKQLHNYTNINYLLQLHRK